MYDLDDDDSISRAELLAVLHMMVGSNISDEQVCQNGSFKVLEKKFLFFQDLHGKFLKTKYGLERF